MTAAAAVTPLIQLVARDPRVAADVRRLAAAVGVDVAVVDPAVVAAGWRTAAVVLVEAAMAASVRALRLPHRGGVVVLADRPDDLSAWQSAVAIGAGDVAVLPDEEHRLLALLAAGAAPSAPPARQIAVVAGSSAAGASTAAAALALGAAGERPVVLVDADPWGGGLDLLLGAESVPGPRWPDLPALGASGACGVVETLPVVAGSRLLSADRNRVAALAPDALGEVLAAAGTTADLVVVDVSRARDAAAALAVATSETVVLLVRAEVRAAAAAAATVRAFALPPERLRLVVRAAPHARVRPAEVARALGVGAVTALRHDPSVSDASDRGALSAHVRRGVWAALATEILAGTDGG